MASRDVALPFPDVASLRRRPPGPRLLIYLDQSTRSCLAKGEAPELLDVSPGPPSAIAGLNACPFALAPPRVE
jgi:hypothetical protein